MKIYKYSVIFVFFALISGCSGSSKPTPAAANFPSAANKRSKNLYITLYKTSKETRAKAEIISFLKKRLFGAGMRAKINTDKDWFFVTIENSDIPDTLRKSIEGNIIKAKEYFKELLEQKIRITMQKVDSSYMESLPPGIVKSGGDYFGSVVNARYKSQLRPPLDAAVYHIVKGSEKFYMVVKKRVLLDGSDILSAKMEKVRGMNWILLKFNRSGASKFSEYTRRLIQERIAILVNGWVLAAPVVTEHIPDGEAWISGKMTKNKALQMAAFFNASGGFGVKLENLLFR
jgi:preprotein translocase subunit SecD